MKFLNLILILLICSCSTQYEETYTIQELPNPSEEGASLPRLFTDNSGSLFMSWVNTRNGEHALYYSRFEDTEWSEPRAVVTDSSWFVNWADFPSVITENGKPVAAHWLKKIPGNTYSYNISLSSFDNSWSDPITLHDDSTATEHGFVSMLPDTGNTYLAVWLDGRETAGHDHDAAGSLTSAMTLRAARVHAGNHEVTERYLVDPSVCDCCNTALAKTDRGYIVAYRNRTEDEIRDIYITRFDGNKWTEGKTLYDDNWQINGCPVNGPGMDASGSDVAVAWFTGANNEPLVKLSLSSDYGQTFSEPVILDNTKPDGRVDVNFDGEAVWVSWIGTDEMNDDPLLKIRRFDAVSDSENYQSWSMKLPSKNRSLGFPQISPFKGGILIAYTDPSGLKPEIKTAALIRQP